MRLPVSCRAAVMIAPRCPLELRNYPTPKVGPHELLVRISVASLCGSDLHTWEGHRTAPTPVILGHEAVGFVEHLGEGRTHDGAGSPLAVGDRVTWTVFSHCGVCDFCTRHALPMKCRSLRKFGHESSADSPHLLGGLADRCLLDAGTAVLGLPKSLSDRAAAPANCATATAIAACDVAGVRQAKSLLIQGAGAVGIYSTAYAATEGCAQVVVADTSAKRLELALSFGATSVLLLDDRNDADPQDDARRAAPPDGFDVVMGFTGSAAALGWGLGALRVGGVFIEAGCVCPGARTAIDLSTLVSRVLTIRGVHNYRFEHLRRAVQFLAETDGRFTWDRVVGNAYPLESVNEAFQEALRRDSLRIGVTPE